MIDSLQSLPWYVATPLYVFSLGCVVTFAVVIWDAHKQDERRRARGGVVEKKSQESAAPLPRPRFYRTTPEEMEALMRTDVVDLDDALRRVQQG